MATNHERRPSIAMYYVGHSSINLLYNEQRGGGSDHHFVLFTILHHSREVGDHVKVMRHVHESKEPSPY